MRFCNLINIPANSLVLGNASAAIAEEQSESEQASKTDDLATTGESAAKSGTVVATHLASNADELEKNFPIRFHR